MKTKVLSLLLTLLSSWAMAQGTAREDYVRRYYQIAIKEMQSYGIPASITMAQGILESGSGTTFLALEANNHFGIKCHDWTGPSVRRDDDAKNECFRQYEHALQSFEDHSKFLSSRSRYAFLFDYDITDYKAWAKGLKKAGYATDPHYPQKLIRIIEENELYLLDEYALAAHPDPSLLPEAIRQHEDVALKVEETAPATEEAESPTIAPIPSKVHRSPEGLHYIVVTHQESYEAIAAAHKLHLWELYKYNDLPREHQAAPEPGQRLYLERKKTKCEETMSHKVKAGETLYDIAQFYGITLKALRRINAMDEGMQAAAGSVIYLNKKALR